MAKVRRRAISGGREDELVMGAGISERAGESKTRAARLALWVGRGQVRAALGG
jgi:hypothetical protein